MLLQKDVPAQITFQPLPKRGGGQTKNGLPGAWAQRCWMASRRHSEVTGEAAWWLKETHARIKAINQLVRDYRPWMLPEFAPLRAIAQIGLGLEPPIALADAPEFASQLEARLDRMWATSSRSGEFAAQRKAALSAAQYDRATEGAERFTRSDCERCIPACRCRWISASCWIRTACCSRSATTWRRESCIAATYDMLASEARIATFLAIAKGDIPATKLVQADPYAHPRLRIARCCSPGRARCSNT